MSKYDAHSFIHSTYAMPMYINSPSPFLTFI